MKTALPRTVVVLGVVSFFTDFSSEMIYPLLPAFLTGVLGAGAAALGLIEGVAESTASLLKVYSGRWTDRTRRRKPLILAGYSLAGTVRPLVGLATSWTLVLGLRFLDRVGKGLRTAPRDALIADAVPEAQRGRAYGFHRSLDHAGAVVGPLAAAALLALEGVSLRHVFLLASLPAAVVVVLIVLGIRETPAVATASGPPPNLWQGWRDLGADFRRLLLAVVVFTLGNSTDAFLLLSLTSAGVQPAWVAVLWSLHHGVKMLATYLGGSLADRIGYRLPILGGWVLYALVYAGFGAASTAPAQIALFLLYGVYFGLTEPAEKAWVSRLVPPQLRGTAFGWYHGAVGLGALPASLLFGVLWQQAGAAAAFLTGAGLAASAALLLLRVRHRLQE